MNLIYLSNNAMIVKQMLKITLAKHNVKSAWFARNIKAITKGVKETIEAVQKLQPKKEVDYETPEMYIQVERLLKTHSGENYDEKDVKELTQKLMSMNYSPKQISEILNRTGKLEKLTNATKSTAEAEMFGFSAEMDSEIKKQALELDRIQSIVKRHNKERLPVLAEQSSYPAETPAKVKYEDFINEILSEPE